MLSSPLKRPILTKKYTPLPPEGDVEAVGSAEEHVMSAGVCHTGRCARSIVVVLAPSLAELAGVASLASVYGVRSACRSIGVVATKSAVGVSLAREIGDHLV